MRGRSFYIPFDWLQAAWNDIHGAFHVNVKRIGGSSKDSRRLSRYIVSQYCGDQNGLVRLSQSKPEKPLAKMRQALRHMAKTMPERYEFANTLTHLAPEEFDIEFRKAIRQQCAAAWDSLVRVGSCELFGVQLIWLEDRLQRV